jgi:hypothetical protein
MEVFYPDWFANAVVVLKKNNTWRMCIDYMSLNKACRKDIMKCSYAQSNSLTLFILSNKSRDITRWLARITKLVAIANEDPALGIPLGT